MKKKKILNIIFSVVILVFIYNTYQYFNEKNQQNELASKITTEVANLIDPIIENTSFIVEDDQYFLKPDKITFYGDPAGRSARMNIMYLIYKNGVTDNHLIANDQYSPHTPYIIVAVERLDKDREYSLSPARNSYTAQLFDTFIDYYFDYHYLLNNEENWLEKDGSTSWNEEAVKLDEFGIVQDGGNAIYLSERSARNQKVNAYAEFVLKPANEIVEVPLSITQPEDWK